MERHPLIRITKIDQCLRARTYTSLVRLIDETASSRRTVYRDLSALQQMGAPVGYSREHKGYFYVQGNNFKLPDIALTEGDLFAIILTEQAISAIDKNYLGKKLGPSIEKLRLIFQKKIKLSPSKVFSFGPSPQPTLTKNVISNIEQILKAIEQKKKLYCKYKKPGKEDLVELTIEPYHLHFRGKWYLFGWSEYSKDFRTYAIQRIDALEVLKKEFTPRDFTIEQYLGNAWGIIKGKKTEVVLEFTKEQAVFLQEKQWHPSQRIIKLKNGMMKMTLTVDGLDEVFWWILSYGSNVKVIKPIGLIKKIITEANNLINMYD